MDCPFNRASRTFRWGFSNHEYPPVRPIPTAAAVDSKGSKTFLPCRLLALMAFQNVHEGLGLGFRSYNLYFPWFFMGMGSSFGTLFGTILTYKKHPLYGEY